MLFNLRINYYDDGDIYQDVVVLPPVIQPQELRQLIIEFMDEYGANYHSSEIVAYDQTRRTYAESLRKEDELNRVIQETEREMGESQND